MIKIGQNTDKSLRDLSRLVVTQTPVNDHQLTLVWKTRKVYDYNYDKGTEERYRGKVPRKCTKERYRGMYRGKVPRKGTEERHQGNVPKKYTEESYQGTVHRKGPYRTDKTGHSKTTKKILPKSRRRMSEDIPKTGMRGKQRDFWAKYGNQEIIKKKPNG